MPYIILKSDGTTLGTVDDQTINTALTSLSLAGRGIYNYGLPVATDLVHLCENFSSATPPVLPLEGQLWYNDSTANLMLWTGSAWVSTASLDNQAIQYVIDTGAVNACVAALAPAPAAYVAGMTCTMVVAHTNTGPTTLNLNGLGVKTVVFPDGSPLIAGQIVANGLAQFVYNGTNFVLMTPVSNTVNANAIQTQSTIWAIASGTANSYAVTLSPAPAAYVAGLTVVAQIPVGAGNTGSSTLNVNGLGAQSILNTDGSLLSANQLPAGGVCTFIFDGNHFQIVSTPTATKQRLNAVTYLYVANSGNGGSNSNLGTAASPFGSIQYAYDYAVRNIDLNGYTLVIQLANDTNPYTNPGGGVTNTMVGASINSAGTGLTNGNALFTVAGGTPVGGPSGQAQFTAVVSGGSVVPGTLVIVNVGSYSVAPPLTANACTVGLGTTNATFNLTFISQPAPILSMNAPVSGLLGYNNVILNGNPTTPSAVVLAATNATCILAGPGSNLNVSGITFSATGTSGAYSSAGIALQGNGGFIGFGYCNFLNCGYAHIVSGQSGSTVTSGGQPYSITNNGGTQSQIHMAALGGNITTALSTVTINSYHSNITNVQVNAVGSGLTNGTRTFTVVGGTGTPCTFTATVTSGSVVASSVVITNNGSYTVLPTTMTANACTVDTGSTNATFNLSIFPHFGTAFAVAEVGGLVTSTAMTFINGDTTLTTSAGIATGNQASATYAGIIETGAGAADYFPGDRLATNPYTVVGSVGNPSSGWYI